MDIDAWAVSNIVFLYSIVPALVNPVAEGLLKSSKGQVLLYRSFGKFVLKLCNNIRYLEEDDQAATLNVVLDVLRPLYLGFCRGVVLRVCSFLIFFILAICEVCL